MIVVIRNLHQGLAPLVQDGRTPTASTSPADTPVNKKLIKYFCKPVVVQAEDVGGPGQGPRKLFDIFHSFQIMIKQT
jgi:hypothetical protein